VSPEKNHACEKLALERQSIKHLINQLHVFLLTKARQLPQKHDLVALMYFATTKLRRAFWIGQCRLMLLHISPSASWKMKTEKIWSFD